MELVWTHYNDDDEFQFHYSNYEGKSVPISAETLARSQIPFDDDSFPYFYEGSTMNDYQSALALEIMGCCVAKMEYANLNGIGKTL